MLNERNKLTSLIDNSKKLYNNSSSLMNNTNNNNLVISSNNSSNNLYFDKMKNDNNMNFIKNGQLSPPTISAAAKLNTLALLQQQSQKSGGHCNNGDSDGLNNGSRTNGSNGNSSVKSERLSPVLTEITVEPYLLQNANSFR